jgi:hypothetical protein
LILTVCLITSGASKGGGGCGAAGPQTPPKPKLKRKCINMILRILLDLTFGRNQSLKSADD